MSEKTPGVVRQYAELVSEDVRDKLHIGGTERKAGWQVLNVQAGEHVDHVADLRKLDQFADNSFDLVYGSHVLEHFGYMDDLPEVLESLRRIIRPRGRLLVSVPDLDTLCRMFLDEALTFDERFEVMRIMFGGQTDSYDFHYVGLNKEILTYFLQAAGFREVFRVPHFTLFDDMSQTTFRGKPVSVNVVAIK